jgi:hypothetical protein
MLFLWFTKFHGFMILTGTNLKVGIFGHLTIQLTCATDAESLGNETVNQNV